MQFVWMSGNRKDLNSCKGVYFFSIWITNFWYHWPTELWGWVGLFQEMKSPWNPVWNVTTSKDGSTTDAQVKGILQANSPLGDLRLWNLWTPFLWTLMKVSLIPSFQSLGSGKWARIKKWLQTIETRWYHRCTWNVRHIRGAKSMIFFSVN